MSDDGRIFRNTDMYEYTHQIDKAGYHSVIIKRHKYLVHRLVAQAFINDYDEQKDVHHIDEDKAIMLSNDQFAAKNPFEYQKADRLVYCNILEHLLLHVKIAEEPRSADANQGELPGVGGAVTMICRQINDYFNGYNFKQDYMVAAMKLIEDSYDEYIRILKHLWTVIEGNPLYSQLIKKEDLAKGWDGKVIDKILVEL